MLGIIVAILIVMAVLFYVVGPVIMYAIGIFIVVDIAAELYCRYRVNEKVDEKKDK